MSVGRGTPQWPERSRAPEPSAPSFRSSRGRLDRISVLYCDRHAEAHAEELAVLLDGVDFEPVERGDLARPLTSGAVDAILFGLDPLTGVVDRDLVELRALHESFGHTPIVIFLDDADGIDHVLRAVAPFARDVLKRSEIASLGERLKRVARDGLAAWFDEIQRVAPNDLGTRSLQMQTIYDQLQRFAGAGADVLLFGETGVGKGMLARFAHEVSGRAIYKSYSCAEVPSTLLPAALFGQIENAFNGAEERVGWLRQAHLGMVLLDEIAELSNDDQVTLLRFMDDRNVVPLGSDKGERVDVVVLGATNRPAGLREDLFYRFVARIEVPPLRHRREDIPSLAKRLAEDRNPARPLQFGRDALMALCRYDWPGNVREMAHAIDRLDLSIDDRQVLERHVYSVLSDDGAVSGLHVSEEARRDQSDAMRRVRRASSGAPVVDLTEECAYQIEVADELRQAGEDPRDVREFVASLCRGAISRSAARRLATQIFLHVKGDASNRACLIKRGDDTGEQRDDHRLTWREVSLLLHLRSPDAVKRHCSRRGASSEVADEAEGAA